jgi:hypothetical protein
MVRLGTFYECGAYNFICYFLLLIYFDICKIFEASTTPVGRLGPITEGWITAAVS